MLVSWTFVWFIGTRFKEKKKEREREKKKTLQKRKGEQQWKIDYYINAKWQILVPYGSMLHLSPINYHLLAAKQEPYKKAYLLTKTVEEFSGGKNQKNGSVKHEKDKTERAMGVGRGTREETVNWNKMTAPRFQRGGRHTSPASLRG